MSSKQRVHNRSIGTTISYNSNITNLVRGVAEKGFYHLLSANMLTGLAAFAFQLIIAKLLIPVQLGQIRTMQSFTAIGITLGGFGFNAAALKLCSEKRPHAACGLSQVTEAT